VLWCGSGPASCRGDGDTRRLGTSASHRSLSTADKRPPHSPLRVRAALVSPRGLDRGDLARRRAAGAVATIAVHHEWEACGRRRADPQPDPWHPGTAAAGRADGLDPVVDERLREFDFGEGEGRTRAEMAALGPDRRAAFEANPAGGYVPGGEDPRGGGPHDRLPRRDRRGQPADLGPDRVLARQRRCGCRVPGAALGVSGLSEWSADREGALT
jgi:hypothetical protein